MYRFENIEKVSFNSRVGHSVEIYELEDNDYVYCGNYFVQGEFSEEKAIRKMHELESNEEGLI